MTSKRTRSSLDSDSQSSPFVRRMIDSHSVLGLAFAALIYVVSLSGALTLFVPEISLWESPNMPTAYQTTPEAIATAAENAEAQLTDRFEILNVIVTAPDEFRPYMTVRLNERKDPQSPLQSIDWIADPATGELGTQASAPYAHVIEDLHTLLHLPRPWGRYLVGLLGVAMFTLILSGICAHPTMFKDAFKLRLDRNARMAWTDIHNRLSVWGLPFHLIITFTGAFLGIAGLIVAALAMVAYDGDQDAAIQVIQGPQALSDMPPMSASPDYEQMLKDSQGEGRTFSIMIAANPKDSGNTTSIAYYEDGILSMRTSDIYRNTGEFLEKFGGSGSPTGARAFGMVQPLHYGTFGGYPIKLLYFVLSLALTYITSTGMMIWFKRKMQQGQPKPKSEAAWRGMTTGLSLSLAATALATATQIDPPLEPIFFGVWAVSLTATYFSGNLVQSIRLQYGLIAAVLVATAGLHLPYALTVDSTAQPLLLAIDGAILATSLGFAGAALKGVMTEKSQKTVSPS